MGRVTKLGSSWLAVFLSLVAAVVVSGIGVGTARAESSLGSFGSTTCAATALTWRIGYSLYWLDDGGRTTTRTKLPAIEEQLQLFVDNFALDTGCSLGVVVDVFDMQGQAWDHSNGAATSQALRSRGNYDSTFFRYPAIGNEGLAGVTYFGQPFSRAEYPVTAAGCQLGDATCAQIADPWYMLLFHEFLHQIVYFYKPLQGWPINDVHGGAQHGFPDRPYVNEPYFTAMLRGCVAEGTALRGMLPSDYLNGGTPTRPGNGGSPPSGSPCPLPPRVQLPSLGTGLVLKTDPPAASARYTPPSDFDGTLGLTVTPVGASDPIEAISLTGSSSWNYTFPRPGSYNICRTFNGSARYTVFPYSLSRSCGTWIVPESAYRALLPSFVPTLAGTTVSYLTPDNFDGLMTITVSVTGASRIVQSQSVGGPSATWQYTFPNPAAYTICRYFTGSTRYAAESEQCVEFIVPPDAFPLPSLPLCVVPRLNGMTLRAASQSLVGAHCTLGRVTYVNRHASRVTRQRPQAGTELPNKGSVSVWLSK